jgi:hypothetical protein
MTVSTATAADHAGFELSADDLLRRAVIGADVPYHRYSKNRLRPPI